MPSIPARGAASALPERAGWAAEPLSLTLTLSLSLPLSLSLLEPEFAELDAELAAGEYEALAWLYDPAEPLYEIEPLRLPLSLYAYCVRRRLTACVCRRCASAAKTWRRAGRHWLGSTHSTSPGHQQSCRAAVPFSDSCLRTTPCRCTTCPCRLYTALELLFATIPSPSDSSGRAMAPMALDADALRTLRGCEGDTSCQRMSSRAPQLRRWDLCTCHCFMLVRQVDSSICLHGSKAGHIVCHCHL